VAEAAILVGQAVELVRGGSYLAGSSNWSARMVGSPMGSLTRDRGGVKASTQITVEEGRGYTGEMQRRTSPRHLLWDGITKWTMDGVGEHGRGMWTCAHAMRRSTIAAAARAEGVGIVSGAGGVADVGDGMMAVEAGPPTRLDTPEGLDGAEILG